MNSSAFDLGEKLNNQTVKYFLHKPLWDRFNFPSINLDFSLWQKVKYLNITGDDFNTAIETIPNTRGGLYLFYVKCDIVSGITEYPFYIGRAQYTDHQNLRKRVKEYFQHFSKNDERPKITRMFKYWANDLHLAYFPLDDNTDIIDLEKQLINFLLLPMNDQIPDKEIKQAIKAF
jgi:excinuclease UvrABC nuclease subunit